ncbi:MAG: nitroreductase family protein [Thermotogota bacterium]
MNFLELVKKRRSVRSFLDKDVDDETINYIIESARYAPSGGNTQNFIFGVIKDKKIIEELSEAAGNQDWIKTAPVVIACCAYTGFDLSNVEKDSFALEVNVTRFGENFVNYMNNYDDREMMNIFWENGSPLIPGEHIFLAATEKGLNACWIGYMDILKVGKILNLPKDINCLFLMPIGYATEKPDDKDIKPLKEIVFYDKWQ